MSDDKKAKPLHMSEADAALHFGELPTPQDGETQDAANMRVLRDSIAKGHPPDRDTPLFKWAASTHQPSQADIDLLKPIIGLINERRLLVTLDESGDPFYTVDNATLSLHSPDEIAAGAKRKIILWYHADDEIDDAEAIYKP